MPQSERENLWTLPHHEKPTHGTRAAAARLARNPLRDPPGPTQVSAGSWTPASDSSGSAGVTPGSFSPSTSKVGPAARDLVRLNAATPRLRSRPSAAASSSYDDRRWPSSS